MKILKTKLSVFEGIYSKSLERVMFFDRHRGQRLGWEHVLGVSGGRAERSKFLGWTAGAVRELYSMYPARMLR